MFHFIGQHGKRLFDGFERTAKTLENERALRVNNSRVFVHKRVPAALSSMWGLPGDQGLGIAADVPGTTVLQCHNNEHGF